MMVEFSEEKNDCCESEAEVPFLPPAETQAWREETLSTDFGEIPRVSTTLRFPDHLGAWKARWGIGRMRYRIESGLYGVGRPTSESPVFVTANYKMSFDRLRSHLYDRDGWILVLDTGGINVWCAAGKGTFGTEEVVRRVEAAHLSKVVSHRTLVLPQLGAPGVAAHEVRHISGFRVVYGPVRAEDLPAFLDAGMRTTPEMRRVRFTLRDRLALVPMELRLSAKWVVFAAMCFFLLAGWSREGFSSTRAVSEGLRAVALLVTAWLAGAALTPVLLPWTPGRSFSAKGGWIGLTLALGFAIWSWNRTSILENRVTLVSWLLMMPVVASFLAMNFTGASTYTSLSGVRREVRIALPLQIAGAALGVGLWLAGRFV